MENIDVEKNREFARAIQYAQNVLNRGNRELAKEAISLLSNHDRKILARTCRALYASGNEVKQIAFHLSQSNYREYIEALVGTVEQNAKIVVQTFFELVEKRYPAKVAELHERFDAVYGVDLSVLLIGRAPFDIFVTKDEANHSKQVYGVENP